MTIFSFYNVTTTLAAAITSSDTSISLTSASGLPTAIPTGTDVALAINSATTGGSFEIVYVTAISGTTITVSRGQDGTTAVAHSAGDYCNSVPSAGQNANFAQLPQLFLNLVNATSSRVSDTTYTNSHPGPMYVGILFNAAGGSTVNFLVNGLIISDFVLGSGGGYCSVGGMVPPGATYEFTVANYAGTIDTWTEMN